MSRYPIVQSAGQLAEVTNDAWRTSGWSSHSLALYGRRESYAKIIRTQPNVRTVISFLARNVAQLGVHLYDRVTDTARDRVTDHPFVEALKRPNPLDRRLTTYRLMHRTVWDVAAFDVAFWALLPLDGDPFGRPVIVPLRPDRLEIKGTMWPTEYVVHGPNGSRSIPPDQVVYFQGSHNLDNPLWGLPPIEALRRIIAEDVAAGEYREQFWTRGARFDMILSRPADAPKWSDAARERFKADWRKWSGAYGEEAGGTPILEEGMTAAQVEGPDARSSQYVEARKLSRAEAAALYHVDPIWVGITEGGVAFASVVERHKALYQDTLGPWVTMLEQDLTFQALPAFGSDPDDSLYVKLNIAEKLRGSVTDQADSIQKLVGRPLLTVNEGRALIERNEVPAGDGLVVPLNLRVVPTDEEADVPMPTLAPVEEPLPEPVESSRVRRSSKAVGPSQAEHDAFAAAHREAHRLAILRLFARQLVEILAQLGTIEDDEDPNMDDIWDGDRWDSELGADLFGLGLDTASGYAAIVAQAIGFAVDQIDEGAWITWMSENTRIAAENINASTFESLRGIFAAGGAAAAIGAAIRNIFTGDNGQARAEQIGQTRYTDLTGFIGQDVAAQAGRLNKVWMVTASNSRHPEMDGETVAMGETFSNGCRWPGDSAGDVDQTAGCQCMMLYE